MSALRSWRGPFLTVFGLLAVWQLLYWIVGDIALRSPLDTIRHSWTLFQSPSMWPHVAETATAFTAAITWFSSQPQR